MKGRDKIMDKSKVSIFIKTVAVITVVAGIFGYAYYFPKTFSLLTKR